MKLADVVDVELLDKRGYLTICVSLEKDGKVFLRKTEGIKEWYKQLAVSILRFSLLPKWILKPYLNCVALIFNRNLVSVKGRKKPPLPQAALG